MRITASLFLAGVLTACHSSTDMAKSNGAAGQTGQAGIGSAGIAASGTGVSGGLGGAGGKNSSGSSAPAAPTGGRSGTGGNTQAGASGGSGSVTQSNTSGSSAAGTQGGIWMPQPGVTWQWQLTGNLDTSVDAQMYDIDLFETTPDTIQALHQDGRHVVCYFSAGSYEPGRPDSAALMKTGLGSTLDGWPDEKWLDIRSSAVRDIMKARLDLAHSKGCDGVEPDNVDGFDNENGLKLTQQDQLDYNQFLATEGHARQLSVGLKNCLALVPKLVGSFDWALNEECLKEDECADLKPFISADKAVFHCEYAKSTSGICDKKPQGFSTIVKNLDLDAFRLTCP
jgi:Glycoside-hydrolase family GH114